MKALNTILVWLLLAGAALAQSPEVQVRSFGAKCDGTTVDTTAIQKAIDSTNARTVVFPGTTCVTRQLTIPSNRELVGVPGSTVLKRDPSWTGTNNIMVLIGTNQATVENVTVRGIRFDSNGFDSFGRVIQIGAADDLAGSVTKNVRILDNDFIDSDILDTPGDNKWAISFKSKWQGVWIENNYVNGDMQLHANGGSHGGNGLFVLNNQVFDARDSGANLSTLTTTAGVVFENLHWQGNIFEATSSCLVFGPDQSGNTTGSWRHITITGNTCYPTSDAVAGWKGFIARGSPDGTFDVTIADNVVDGVSAGSDIGIDVDIGSATGAVAANGVNVARNTLRDLRHGIRVVYAANVAVAGNVINNATDGIEVGNGGDVTDQVVISGNVITGGTRAIALYTVEDALVVGNSSTTGGGASQGRLHVAPALGKTATVFATGNKFKDAAAGTGVRINATGTANVYLVNNDLSGNASGAISGAAPTYANHNRQTGGWSGSNLISPAQLTAEVDDYAPTGNESNFWRLTSNASQNIAGIANGIEGRRLVIVNVGAQNIVIRNQDSSSAGGNRIITGTGADITLVADDTCELIYDSTTARWRVINSH